MKFKFGLERKRINLLISLIIIIKFFQFQSNTKVNTMHLKQLNFNESIYNQDQIQDNNCISSNNCFDCINKEFCDWENYSCTRTNIQYL